MDTALDIVFSIAYFTIQGAGYFMLIVECTVLNDILTKNIKDDIQGYTGGYKRYK